MSLPINIEQLLNGNTVEWERVELKKGWNPEVILHSICAFANDINNWGGGYIIVGVDEDNGQPVLPPEGINRSDIDNIQKEILNMGRSKINETYIPVVEPVEFQGKMILVIWAPFGSNRPYEASEFYHKKASPKHVYVRRTSNTVKASKAERSELNELSVRIPFVEQPNHRVGIESINRQLIVDYLKDIGSSTYEDAKGMSLADLCKMMKIVDGPEEHLIPKNIGLLFFSDKPSEFFYKALINVVIFTKDEADDEFDEKVFEGPIHHQIKDALHFISSKAIIQRVTKISNQAEADVFYNFPYQAIEEALVNAVYHKSYQSNEPVEVRIYPERIDILSYPGPLPPLSKESFEKKMILARRYRNGRVGDMLKELRLAESKGSGVPKIKKELKKNGSPDPVFDTDEDRTYFNVTIHSHEAFVNNVDAKSLFPAMRTSKNERVSKLMVAIKDNQGSTRADLVAVTGIPEGTIKKYITELIELDMIIPIGDTSNRTYVWSSKAKNDFSGI